MDCEPGEESPTDGREAEESSERRGVVRVRECLRVEEQDDDQEVARDHSGEEHGGEFLNNIPDTQSDGDGVLAVGREVEVYLGMALSSQEVFQCVGGVEQYEVVTLRDDQT